MRIDESFWFGDDELDSGLVLLVSQNRSVKSTSKGDVARKASFGVPRDGRSMESGEEKRGLEKLKWEAVVLGVVVPNATPPMPLPFNVLVPCFF
jgi:hypothetical protein